MLDDAYSSRIKKLETDNGRFKWGLGLMIIFFLILVLGERFRTKNTLQAKEFLLTDESGQVVARLGTGASGTCFEILGKTKAAGAIICVGDNAGSSLELTTNHGASKAFFSAGGKIYEAVGQTLSPGLILVEEGKSILSATVGEEPGFLTGPGKEASLVVSVPQDKPRITISGNNGKVLWSAP